MASATDVIGVVRVEFGNLAEWAAAVGTFVAFIAAFRAIRHQQRLHEEATELQRRRQAGAVSVEIVAALHPDQQRVIVHNPSPTPLFGCAVELFPGKPKLPIGNVPAGQSVERIITMEIDQGGASVGFTDGDGVHWCAAGPARW